MNTTRQVRLGRLFERQKILGFVDEPMLSVFREHGVVLKDDMVNHNQTAEDRGIYQLVGPGWLAVNRMKAWQGSLGISGLRGIMSGHYICFAPKHTESDRYLHYLLRSPRMTAHFSSISRGVRTGQIEIDNDQLAATVLALPSPEEQRRIADFLDDRVARIDQIITARGAQLSSAQQAGIAELQEIQDTLMAKYGHGRLGYLLRGLEQGWSPQAEAQPAPLEEWGVMRSGCVNGGVFRADDNKRLPEDIEPQKQYEIRDGDLLMSRASGSLDLIGSLAVVPAATRNKLILCDKIYRLSPAEGWRADFLAPMLRSHANRALIRLGVSGAEGMANNLPSGVVRSLRIPLVPEREQASVVAACALIESRLELLARIVHDATPPIGVQAVVDHGGGGGRSRRDDRRERTAGLTHPGRPVKNRPET